MDDAQVKASFAAGVSLCVCVCEVNVSARELMEINNTQMSCDAKEHRTPQAIIIIIKATARVTLTPKSEMPESMQRAPSLKLATIR